MNSSWGGCSHSLVIEVEGPSGAGKSTLIERLAERSRDDLPYVDVSTIEAGYEAPAWRVGVLMRGLSTQLDPTEAAFLYSARSAGRSQQIMRLASQQKVIVVSDRLRLSLLVQFRLAGVAADTAAQVVRLATHDLRPHLTVLLDVAYQEHVRRVTSRGHQPIAAREFACQRRAFREAYECIGATATGLFVDTSDLTAEQVCAQVHARAARLAGMADRTLLTHPERW